MKFVHRVAVSRNKEPYPARTMRMRLLDVLVYVVGILGPLATIPQIVQIYTTHNVSGISFFTWSLYALFDIPWIIYAAAHREPPLIVCYSLWLIFNSLVAIGVLLHSPTLIF